MLPTPPPSPVLNGSAAVAAGTDMRLGHVLAGRIELTGVLGIGAYGTVYTAKDLATGVPYAVKALNKVGLSKRQRKFIDQEIQLHQRASSHPNVVTLIEVISTHDTIFVVLEYCPEGDLFGNITEHSHYVGDDYVAKHIFLQLLDAVEYCHSIGVYHRDLKPENILISNGGMIAKLADFGLACTEALSSDFGCGSTFYMSPECLQESPKAFSCYASAPNDVWSLGVILVNLTSGRNPWKKASVDDSTFAAFLRDSEFLKSILPLTDELDCILRYVFECDPARRITIPQLRRMIVKCDAFTTNSRTSAALCYDYYSPAPTATADYTDAPHALATQFSNLTTSSGSSGSDADWLLPTPSPTSADYASCTEWLPPQIPNSQSKDATRSSNVSDNYEAPVPWYSNIFPAIDLAHKHLSVHPVFPAMQIF